VAGGFRVLVEVENEYDLAVAPGGA
jgi:hypothetical protein